MLVSIYTYWVKFKNTLIGIRWFEATLRGKRPWLLNKHQYLICVCIEMDASICGKSGCCPLLGKLLWIGGKSLFVWAFIEMISEQAFMWLRALVLTLKKLWKKIIDILVSLTWYIPICLWLSNMLSRWKHWTPKVSLERILKSEEVF